MQDLFLPRNGRRRREQGVERWRRSKPNFRELATHLYKFWSCNFRKQYDLLVVCNLIKMIYEYENYIVLDLLETITF
jgi:hypothetical protein